MDNLTELFCRLDDFCLEFEPAFTKRLLGCQQKRRQRATSVSLSEMMTLVVLFHQMRFRQFKIFYTEHVQHFLKSAFPGLPSYSRIVQLMPRCLAALCAFFEHCKGQCTGISIVDSTALAVCKNRRIQRHKVFRHLASRGHTSTGWFFGFKLHLVINHQGGLLNIQLTPGNTDDRKSVPALCSNLFGKLFGDKGYLSKTLSAQLQEMGIELITKVRKNMKPLAHSDFDQAILKKRSLVETVIDELKNLCQIEHSRHRSILNCLVNLMAGIIAYCLFPHKPSLPLRKNLSLNKS